MFVFSPTCLLLPIPLRASDAFQHPYLILPSDSTTDEMPDVRWALGVEINCYMNEVPSEPTFFVRGQKALDCRTDEKLEP